MILSRLETETASVGAVVDAWPLLAGLYPICRSLTGQGVRDTLARLGEIVPLERTEVASGTPVFDWVVPPEWNVRAAYVADETGRRLIDLDAHSLHVVSYSTPIRRRMSRAELEPHLHSLPEHPEWIPYRTSYYRENWGFCLRHRDRVALGSGPFDVVIESTLEPGTLTYGECVIPGSAEGFAIVYTHTCHPSLANDNLSGMLVAALLARELAKEQPRLTWRFILGPGTIGSLTWLSRNEPDLHRLRAGLTIGLLGDPGCLTYKRSRRGDSATDRAAAHVLSRLAPDSRVIEFEPYGYDERQFCSPGFNLPVGRVTRTPNGQYPEYHSSADNLDFIQQESLADSLRVIARLISVVDENRCLVNLSPKGEPRLGKRGLYGSIGGTAPGEFEHALLWVLNFSEGNHDLLHIADRSGLTFDLVAQAAAALERTGLARTL